MQILLELSHLKYSDPFFSDDNIEIILEAKWQAYGKKAFQYELINTVVFLIVYLVNATICLPEKIVMQENLSDSFNYFSYFLSALLICLNTQKLLQEILEYKLCR